MLRSALLLASVVSVPLTQLSTAAAEASSSSPAVIIADTQVRYRTSIVEGVEIFYREAGPKDAPTILLLHGFPTSSHMYRDLIPHLAGRYRVIAPDYPGFGFSGAPSPTQFTYTFDHLADLIDGLATSLGLERYVLFAQDFGGPVGFRLAVNHPGRIAALVIQNANAYDEGLSEALNSARPFWFERTPETEAPIRTFLTAEVTKFQYLHGARDRERISPDAWTHAQAMLDRPGNHEIQLSLLHDYGSNLKRYPQWQAYFRQYQPPTLIVWGKNDPFFTVDGAKAYLRDMPTAELHLLDSGHFAVEEEAPRVAELMIEFLERKVFANNRR